MSSTKLIDIAEALTEALESASMETREKLADAIEVYAKTYPRTVADVRRQPFARALLDAIQEATGCDINDKNS